MKRAAGATGAPDLADVERVLTTIPDLQAEKEYAISEYYERTGHLGSAVYYYRMVRENWQNPAPSYKCRAATLSSLVSM